jgi:hypothetical protein
MQTHPDTHRQKDGALPLSYGETGQELTATDIQVWHKVKPRKGRREEGKKGRREEGKKGRREEGKKGRREGKGREGKGREGKGKPSTRGNTSGYPRCVALRGAAKHPEI